jgi:hypothetical protein
MVLAIVVGCCFTWVVISSIQEARASLNLSPAVHAAVLSFRHQMCDLHNGDFVIVKDDAFLPNGTYEVLGGDKFGALIRGPGTDKPGTRASHKLVPTAFASVEAKRMEHITFVLKGDPSWQTVNDEFSTR